MKAEDLLVTVRVDASEAERMIARMEKAVTRTFRQAGVPDQTTPLALLGAFAVGTQLHRPISRRSLLTGGLR